ncbi:hypothetical protein MKEN_01113300 [Mycena kentingensis (nom. inval.)]|nr:hypothetical protein MKEN_01113300 [Mycena kentingensis (nom. inval.)]
MPVPNKRQSGLNTADCLVLLGEWQIELPAQQTLPALKALVREYMDAHPALMVDDAYASLFTNRERAAYEPPDDDENQDEYPPEWHGIEPDAPPEGRPERRRDPPAGGAGLSPEDAAELEYLRGLRPLLEQLAQRQDLPVDSPAVASSDSGVPGVPPGCAIAAETKSTTPASSTTVCK